VGQRAVILEQEQGAFDQDFPLTHREAITDWRAQRG